MSLMRGNRPLYVQSNFILFRGRHQSVSRQDGSIVSGYLISGRVASGFELDYGTLPDESL